MKINTSVDVTPWLAPNFVHGEIAGIKVAIPIGEAPHDAVRELAVQWIEAVYKKAGMTPNWRFE